MSMKQTLLIIFVAILYQPVCSQIQLGQDINGGNSGGLNGERCGWSIDMSNDGQRMIIGSPYANANTSFGDLAKGEARVFELINGSWSQVGNDIIGTSNENYGFSVCMSGDGMSFAVGGPNDLNGIVKVYRDSSGILVQRGSSIFGNDIGWAVEMSDDGNTLVVSSPDHNNKGLVRVYRWKNSDWNQIGFDIIGTSGMRTGIGIGLSFDGNVLAVGTAVGANDTGFVQTYSLLNDTITTLGNLIKSSYQSSNYFGYTISLGDAGNRLAIGDFISGYVSVYEFTNNHWSKIGTDITPSYSSVYFGWSIAISAFGNKIAIGSPLTTGNAYQSGRTEIYEWSFLTNDWVLQTAINGQSAGDQSGWWVAISDTGNIVGIASPYYQGGKGQVRVYDISILEILEMKNNVAIYPNPTKNFIDVKLGSSFRYQTFNNAGQLILSGDSEGRIDFSNLSAGTYQLLIYTDSDIFSRTIEKL